MVALIVLYTKSKYYPNNKCILWGGSNPVPFHFPIQLLSILTPGAQLGPWEGKDTAPKKCPFPLGFHCVLWYFWSKPCSLDNLTERCYHTYVAPASNRIKGWVTKRYKPDIYRRYRCIGVDATLPQSAHSRSGRCSRNTGNIATMKQNIDCDMNFSKYRGSTKGVVYPFLGFFVK